MDRKNAIELLGLQPNYSKSDLKKAFYRLSLIYHPDKNPDGEEIFKSVNAAYELLSNTIGEPYVYEKNDYDDYLTSFLNQFQDVDIMKIITMTEEMSINLIERMSDDKFEFVCDFLFKYGTNILNLSGAFIEKVKTLQKKRMRDRLVYVVEPSLDDIAKSNIYKLDCSSNEQIFIPLWHHELEYDDFKVLIKPQIPDNVEIDENNNVVVYIVRDIKKVFEDGGIVMNGLPFETIGGENIKCIPFQTIVLNGCGIPRIFNDIYKNNDKSNLIIRLWLK